MSLQERFSGTGVALVTPFNDGKIDFNALERLIEHVISGGVDFLVSLGTTGESVTISDDEHRQVLDFTIKTNNGRLPIVAGIFGGNSTLALVDKIRKFNFEGIDVILSSNPAYNKPSQEGLYKHYMEIADASPKPIILYNVPSRSASNISAETTIRLARSSDKFLAIKEASNDIFQIMKIIRGKPEGFLVLSGDDFMTLPIIVCGGQGVISVIANTTPRPFSDMVRAALSGDIKSARTLNDKLLEFYKLLFLEGNPSGVKAALELQGICSREVRLPLVPMSERGVKLIMTELEDIQG
jgi:4-hydroxy-tetrahydrodipicolinate synthase